MTLSRRQLAVFGAVFGAEKTPVAFNSQKNAQTLPEQLQNTFERSSENVF